MVSTGNATEGNDNADYLTPSKGKARKTTPTGRKGKSVLSGLSQTREALPSNISTKPNAGNSTDVAKIVMGNTSAQRTGVPNIEHAEAKQEVAVVESNHKSTKKNDDTNNNGSVCGMTQHGIEEEIQRLNQESSSDSEQSPTTEVARLKRLLLLQLSLISRQQDLLRLRDREIMQLKASNSNYKCQLSRVRRRMSKRKSDGPDDSPKSTKRKSSEGFQTPQKTREVTFVDSETQTPAEVLPDSNDEAKVPKAKKRRLEYKDDIEVPSRNPSRTVGFKNDDTPGPSHTSSYSDSNANSTAVPISFIDQFQNQLQQALMISPPAKMSKTLSEISSSSPEMPFKICDRCPHCVTFAQEIARLFKTAENAEASDSGKSVIFSYNEKDEKELFEMTGITSQGCEPCSGEEEIVKPIPILRTSTEFYRTSPSFDQNHWWWDLKCDDIIPDKTLKIPTWKVHEIPPLITKAEAVEATDDQAYTKRHAKLELDEKRRKRWDIQRIREFRYTEKLKQKIYLKQGAMYDSANIESFSGLLHDAESVEVDDSLPVNVFGYPAPHLNLEEFSMSGMRSTNASSSKKRVKKP